jgi:hypothetical protein
MKDKGINLSNVFNFYATGDLLLSAAQIINVIIAKIVQIMTFVQHKVLLIRV